MQAEAQICEYFLLLTFKDILMTPERRPGRSRTYLLLFTLLCAPPAFAATPVIVESSRNILDARDTERTVFGKLIYISGIAMQSGNPDFGGISGLQISADGARLLAVTDTGKWITADLLFDEGRLKGLSNTQLSPMHGENGKPLTGKHDADAEALAAAQPGELTGPLYVSFERNARILYYRKGIADAQPVRLPMPPGLSGTPKNGGVEAFARRPNGEFIALTEGMLDADGNHEGWLIEKSGPQGIRLRRTGAFTPTDMEFLPGGDLLILERRYSLLGGPGMQIRRIPADSIVPGALLDGEVLINLAAQHGIDNMEGLAAHQNAEGEIILYVASDNNFNKLQKNLLLMFKLPPS